MSPREKYEAKLAEFEARQATVVGPRIDGATLTTEWGATVYRLDGEDQFGHNATLIPPKALALARWILRMEGVAFGCEHVRRREWIINGENYMVCENCGAHRLGAEEWTLPRWMESEKP